MKAHIVVGSGYGDCGKGLTTDWLAHNKVGRNIVVRHNGGGQAGHTVELDDGTKHTFKHIGSGTFANAATFLSSYFIFNPSILIQELNTLSTDPKCLNVLQKSGMVEIFVDRDSPITVPFDTLINVELEYQRGNNKHGSCGAGINETVTRSADARYKITFSDLLNPELLRNKFELIRNEYVPMRCEELNIKLDDDILNATYEFFFTECEFVLTVCKIGHISMLLDYDHVIFEGAQGLLLDEYHTNFPHVTRSRTGIFNAVQILKNIGKTTSDVYYVTRSYTTRHGAGPLGHEVEGPLYGSNDATNVTNPSQGHLRYAPLDISLLKTSIEDDIDTVTEFNVRTNLVVTHVNVLPEQQVQFVDGGIIQTQTKHTILHKLSTLCGFNDVFFSHSPTRGGVVSNLPMDGKII